MDSYEQDRCCKYLDFDRIDELEEIREKKMEEEQNKPQQMSLGDFMQM